MLLWIFLYLVVSFVFSCCLDSDGCWVLADLWFVDCVCVLRLVTCVGLDCYLVNSFAFVWSIVDVEIWWLLHV